MSNFKTLLLSFAAASVLIWIAAFAADWLHPSRPCLQWEKDYWRDRAGSYNFARVSSFYWSSLCRESARPLVISASEGTGELTFPELLRARGFEADEFKGAHRGLKTIAYLLASPIHEERLKNLRAIAFINPVYFSFAARTDASSVSLTAISNLSYVTRLPSFKQKWDEFLLASPFIGAKSYLDELSLFRQAGPSSVRDVDDPTAPAQDAYDFERNMLKERAPNYTSFRSPFSADVEPARSLFNRVVEFASAHPDSRICFVMLPTNVKNLRHFGRDANAVQADMRALIEKIPAGSRVDLSALDEEPYVFMDPMHLTDFGKLRVLEEVLKTECGKKVFAP